MKKKIVANRHLFIGYFDDDHRRLQRIKIFDVFNYVQDSYFI